MHKFPILFFQSVLPVTKNLLEKPDTVEGFLCSFAVSCITVSMCYIGTLIIRKIAPMIIEIDGKEVTFKASAAVPRLYRIKFGRDIYKDLRQLEKSVGENDEDNSNLDLFSLEMFEDLAWLMARHADPAKVPDSPEEFLDQFNTFSIYQILPQLIELWGLNVQTEVESRKNLEKVSGK